jgi:hypothetical protein
VQASSSALGDVMFELLICTACVSFLMLIWCFRLFVGLGFINTRISHALNDQVEKIKASIRAKAEHPFAPGACAKARQQATRG